MSIKKEFIRTVFLNSESHLMITKYLFNQCPFFFFPAKSRMLGQVMDRRYLNDDLKAFNNIDDVLDFLVEVYSQFTIKELIEWNFTNLSETEMNKAYLGYLKANNKTNIAFSGYARLFGYLVSSVTNSSICKRVEEELGELKTKKQISEIKTWVYDEGM